MQPLEAYIQNSGLVLLHPFIPRYFEITGLAKDRQFINEAAANHGVYLLEYLATGKEHHGTQALELNKLLCGLQPEYTTTPVQITEEEKEEGNSLLKAVTSNWPALKNTSIEGLREAFLIREGKLIAREDKHELYVEKKAYDVLLNQLPWSYTIIKYHWMSKLLFVSWAY